MRGKLLLSDKFPNKLRSR